MSTADVRTVAVVLLGLTAVVFDVRSRRIPNLLTFGGAVLALLYAAQTGGASGLATAAGGWVLGATLFFPFFAVGGMGAGDVKLVAALGAWLGPADTIPLVIFASIAGGVCALVVSLASGYLREALSNVWLMLMHWRVAGLRPMPGLTLRDSQAPKLAYAIPITIGVMVTLWRR
jgi:prepilin peptidase CpaA